MNVATGRAAASLSGILKQHVKLHVLEIRAIGYPDVSRFLESEIGELGSVVEQGFFGGLIGNSLMVMTNRNADALVKTLLQQNSELAGLTSTEQTVLAEVGNIVLNACVSMFANQTGRRLHFGLPRVSLNIEGLRLAEELTRDWKEKIQGLVMKSRLMVGQTEATIFVLILMTVDVITIQALIDEALRGQQGRAS
ncbi:MAG: hypothetical protein ACKOC5_17970 [Chloroflexota bacterium]